jgi:PmbA protein
MSDKKLLELARFAAAEAKRFGADDARISVSRSRDVSVEWRDGRLDRIQESTKQSLSVTLYVDGRYSVNGTSDIRRDVLSKYIENSVSAARLLAPDPHRHLPNPARYKGMLTEDLEIYDEKVPAVLPESRLAGAKDIEAAVRACDNKNLIVSVTSSVSDYEYESICLNTNGLEATEQGTSTWRGATVSIKDGADKRPMGSSYGGGTHMSALPSPGDVGAEAFKRATDQIGSEQVATGLFEVVVENRAVPSLSRHLFGVLSGGAVQQRRSFLEDKLGQKVASPLLSVTSDPHLKGGLASAAWDAEGMATKPRAVFDKGELKTFFLDTYYASKLGVEPTAGGAANLVWSPGQRDADAMVAQMKRGIFITSFLGGNSNDTTGDFSLGIKGFYVEDGRIVHPVSEMNMAGNHLEFWKCLAEVGSDPWPYSANRSPSLRFEDVQCSGKKA